MFICFFMFLCIDSLTNSVIVEKIKSLSLCLFVFLCSYVLIHSLIHSLQVKQWKIWNRRTLDLLTSDEKLEKLAAQPSFNQFKIFCENLVAVERAKVELTLNQPAYVGFTILDLSKTLINFLFNFCGYKKESPFSDDKNKKVIGKMKDELNGKL